MQVRADIPVPGVKRRLAAILSADVKGYTRLMGADEEGTLRALTAHREVIDALIPRHDGRIVGTAGDGVLAAFRSAVEAVCCGLEIQEELAARNADVPADRRLEFRIGINLGDVIVEGDDLYGDGVNVAARIQALAEPGGVYVSGGIYDQIKDKLPFGYEFLGAQRVKNVAEPVRVYRVRRDPATAPKGRAARLRRRWLPATAAGVALILAAGGAGVWYTSRPAVTPPAVTVQPASSGALTPTAALPLPDKPSIAVLPFENFGGDPRWERLADGITEDITTDLARYPDLLVIARSSTMAYKGEATDVRQVGKELGVRYVLEGSLQAADGRVRVTAQLVDASTGGHLWAERYDRPEADLFAVQDEVTQNVAGALGGWYGRLNEARRGEAKRRPPASLEAYDLYLLGVEQKHHFTKESMHEAIHLFSRAVELDPGFARGWCMLGVAYGMAATNGFVDDPLAANRLYSEYIKKAADLDPFDPFTQAQLGWVSALEGDLKGAEAAFDRAVALAPNDPNTLVTVAWGVPLIVGRAEEAVRYAQRALALDPAAPAVYAPALAIAQYVAGAYEEAIAALRRAPLEGGEMLMYLAMTQAQLGHTEEARRVAERIRTEFPSFTVEGYIRDMPVTAPEALAAIREGATKAGLLPVSMQ